MKMKDKHYNHLRIQIQLMLTYALRNGLDYIDKYQTGNFAKADRVQDLQQRFCFDMLHRAELMPYVCEELYPYLNDENIYTALKRILPTIERKY